MPIIHHPNLNRELEVSDRAAEILTTVPRVPWEHGPIPTAKPQKRPRRGTPDNPLTEEE